MLSRDIIGQRAAFYGDAGNPVFVCVFRISPGTESGRGLDHEEDGDNRVLAVPLLAVFASGYSIWREGGEISGIRFMDGFINFFYDQGVTSNVMKRAYMYRDKIPSDQTYILEFLHSGIFARLFGIRVYHGNTVEHALHGGALHMRWVTP